MASSLFLLNAVLALVLLPSEKRKGASAAATAGKEEKKISDNGGGKIQNGGQALKASGRNDGGGGSGGANGKDSAKSRFLANFRTACSSVPTIKILVAKLMYGFFMRSLSSRNFVG